MDIATLIGLVGVLGVMLLQLLLGGSISAFINIPSLIGTVGGAVMALFINFSLGQVLGAAKVATKTVTGISEDPAEALRNMVGYAEKARKEGMLALEEQPEKESDPFLRKGLRLAVDGTDPALITKILELDIEQAETRHKNGQQIFEALGNYGPAFGMIGTLIGLVTMLANMEDPSSIGSGMALALLTTFYGAVLANAFALPLAGKLKLRSLEELNLRWMMVEGIMAIQSGDSPRIVEEKLKSYLTPASRDELENEQ